MSAAIIWGADGGIGKAVTHLLVEKGWDVVAIARHTERVEADVLALIELENVANQAMVDKAMYEVGMEIDSAEFFLYTIGDINQSKADDTASDTWKRIIDANLTGAFHAYKASLPLLTPDAHLFFLGAVSERLKLPGLSAYVAAKAGLEAFVATITKEQRKRAITLVRPGAVDTDFWAKVSLKKPKDAANPTKLASLIWDAWENKTTGVMDITH